jgi:transposase
VFPQLAEAVEIDRIVRKADTVWIAAHSRGDRLPCPDCGQETAKVHGYYRRRLADVPAGAAAVVVELSLRRLVCANLGCPRQTFHEQIPGLAERYARRTPGLSAMAGSVAKALAGRAGASLLAVLGVVLSRTTMLSVLMRLPEPSPATPAVIGVDDFALRKRQRYATVIINAETGERIDVLSDREAETLETWLRSHPGVQIVCRDGSGAYAEAIRRALPEAVQVADRWHLWHNLAEAVLKEVAAHSACWSKTGPPAREGKRAATTRERWQHVHDLRDNGVGLLEITRRLGLALNTVKRYSRIEAPERLVRAPVPAHPRRPVPRLPAQAPGRRPGRARGPVARRDQTARLHRQPEPAVSLHHPRPRRVRPASDLSQAADPLPAHPPRQAQGSPAGMD